MLIRITLFEYGTANKRPQAFEVEVIRETPAGKINLHAVTNRPSIETALAWAVGTLKTKPED